MQLKYITGWDIGGAHTKVAIASNSNSISNLAQYVCPLWKGIDELSLVFKAIRNSYPIEKSIHCITMTGELVDSFDSRMDGVVKIIDLLVDELQGDNIFIFAGEKGLIKPDIAKEYYRSVASANWLASAKYISTKISDALFIDIGSTTCDIITIKDHLAIYEGYSDSERLAAQELVYCGVVRTPLFALCKSAPVQEIFIPIINEYFSNTADVYRLTHELPDYADSGSTQDGRDKDEQCSAARLARMFGYDYDSKALNLWRNIAKYIREQQIQMIINACRKQLIKTSLDLSTPIVGAGVGRFLIKDIASRLNRNYIDFGDLVQSSQVQHGYNVADCAPAVSVACLGFDKVSQ